MPGGIGSVLPAPDGQGAGILDTWLEGRPWSAFRTARAGLASLLRLRKVCRTWLPSYICRSVADAVHESGSEIAWYGTDSQLLSRTEELSKAGAGEAVLCVSYFGRGVDRNLRLLASQRRDLLWIEDRAQALQTNEPVFGDVLLYSPRKLFGVGDGGFIAGSGKLPAPSLPADQHDWHANDARAADPQGLRPDSWFPLFQGREADMDSRPKAASARTLAALARIDWMTEAEARCSNWAYLSGRLSSIALWPQAEVDFVPLAYPIVTNDAAALSTGLTAERIWCARHWADLPSPDTFIEAHTLSRQCLSLPLDGRYHLSDMERMADAVELILDKRERSR